MSVDKLVDSSQLDSDLTSVANAIRTRGGTSADLAFPAGFVSAVGAIGNQYAAADEGKVVSNGALVAQTAHAEVTQNGTIDTTLNNSVLVNVSGGGGGVERTAGTLTFATRTAWDGYTLDVGIDAAQFAIYATTDPLQSNGRTFQGFFVDLATSTAKGALWVSSNAAGSAHSGSLINNGTNVSKSGTVLTFKGGSSDRFQAGITYQWYAWGAAT